MIPNMQTSDFPIRIGDRIVYRSGLERCFMGNNESFTVYLKDGTKIYLTKGEHGHDWVRETYREAWRRTTSEPY